MRNIYTKFYILAIVVVVAIMIGLYVQYTYSRALVYENAQKIAGVSVSVLNEQIEGWLSEKAQVISAAAGFVAMQRWDNADTLAYLKILMQNNPAFSSIYFGSIGNEMINASGWKPPLTFDLRKRPWYVTAVVENRLIYTEAFVNASKDDLIVTIAKPLYSLDGSLLGVIAGDVSVRTVMALVRDKKVGENGFSFLVDGSKKMPSHPGQQDDFGNAATVLDGEYLNFTKLAEQSPTGCSKIYIARQRWVYSISKD